MSLPKTAEEELASTPTVITIKPSPCDSLNEIGKK